MSKNWYIKKWKFKRIISLGWTWRLYCNRPYYGGWWKVGYMYRENSDYNGDSGWRFLCGDEDNKYLENTKNSGLYTQIL